MRVVTVAAEVYFQRLLTHPQQRIQAQLSQAFYVTAYITEYALACIDDIEGGGIQQEYLIRHAEQQRFQQGRGNGWRIDEC